MGFHWYHLWFLFRQNPINFLSDYRDESTYDDVKKSIDEFKDYKASGEKEFKYVVHYFVSKNGFIENALKLANDNKLICYEFKNEKFEKVEYWK